MLFKVSGVYSIKRWLWEEGQQPVEEVPQELLKTDGIGTAQVFYLNHKVVPWGGVSYSVLQHTHRAMKSYMSS